MTFADDFNLRDRDACKIGDIADAVDALLLTSYDTSYDLGGSPTSLATTTTWTTISDTDTSVTIAEGESVFIIASIGLSHSAGNNVRLRITRDTTTTGGVISIDPPTGTGGDLTIASISSHDDIGAGTYTYRVQWYIAAATAYTNSGKITILKFRNS